MTDTQERNRPMTEERRDMTCREAGRRGGKTTSERYGPEFYEEIGGRGGEVTASKYGSEFYEEIGAKGGKQNAANHDHDHFVNIGNKAGAKIKRLIEAGKKALGED